MLLAGRPVSGNFDTTLLDFVEAGRTSSDSVVEGANGVPTIGYNYTLLTKENGKYIITPTLDSDFAGIHTFTSDENALLDQIATDLNNGDKSAAIAAFNGRGSLLDFTITSGVPGDNSETLLQLVLNRHVERENFVRGGVPLQLTTIASDPAMAGTYELIALEDIAYPLDLQPGLLNAVNKGNRPLAWLDILTDSDPGPNRTDVENRRITDANEFGLYSQGDEPSFSDNGAESIHVIRFLESHRERLVSYMRHAGQTAAEISSFITDSKDPARNELINLFGDIQVSGASPTIPDANVVVIPVSGLVDLRGNDHVAGNALIVGDSENDHVTITKAAAQTLGAGQTIVYESGGGTDHVKMQGDTNSTLEIDSGPGTVDVKMADGDTLAINSPGTFSGTISKFTKDDVIDLIGIGTASSAILGANDLLTVTVGGSAYELQLKGNFSKDQFNVAPDGNGTGTDITVVPLPKTHTLITFSEFPDGTTITNQYQSEGIDFTSAVFISDDGADPTSPALSGTPLFNGPISAEFVTASGEPGTVKSFSLDAGYFNDKGSTKLTWYGADGQVLGSKLDKKIGYDHFSVKSDTPIASFTMKEIGAEQSGFSMDNISFGNVTPVAAGAANLALLTNYAASSFTPSGAGSLSTPVADSSSTSPTVVAPPSHST